MNISSLSGLTAVQQQQNLQKSSSKLGAAIAALASGNRLTSASTDISALSIATQLQASVSGLKQAAGGLAQASSLAQVASGGISQIQEIGIQLKNLAQQAASPTLNDENRAALNEQFKELVKQADSIANNTSFGGKKLLNGDLSDSGALSLDKILSSDSEESGSLSIARLTSDSLFGGQLLDISTIAGANGASTLIDNALNKILGSQSEVGSFLKSVDYAVASIDSAIANQEAARSELQDTDFLDAVTQQSQSSLQQNVSLAVAAQSNRLTPALLQLVG